MVFLPIVERELRLATRRKSTYRIRLFTTLIAILVSLLFFLGNAAGSASPRLGHTLFSILTYYAFGLSLLAGVYLAADCVSREKREGTLGLLFLTDLKAYDIVIGKLMTVGLNALYGLVAVLPVTALPLLLGGVTGAEYWRVAFALVNALFFSLATGILVSTCCSNANQAMTATLGLLLIAAIGLPILAGIIITAHVLPGVVCLFSFSPLLPFARATGGFASVGSYAACLASSNLSGWAMLLVTTWLLPRAWQDKPLKQRIATSASVHHRAATSTRRFLNRARLLDRSPIIWLISRAGGVVWRVWGVAVLAGVLSLASFFLGVNEIALVSGWLVLGVLAFFLKIFAATEACRFFVDARRSGALELILSTPLTSREIIRGQWLAFVRVFFGPVIIFFAAYALLAFLQIASHSHVDHGNLHIMGGPFNETFWTRGMPVAVVQIISLAYQFLRLMADLAAIGCMGMWLGLSIKKPIYASGLTILMVVLLPTIFFCIPNIFFDIGFIFWGREKLKNEFRETAIPEYFGGRRSLMPLPNVPPVIRR